VRERHSVAARGLQLAQLRALQPIADDHEMISPGLTPREPLESIEEGVRIFLLREPSDVEQQHTLGGDAKLGADIFSVVPQRMKERVSTPRSL
jgi:hypothetical protein